MLFLQAFFWEWHHSRGRRRSRRSFCLLFCSRIASAGNLLSFHSFLLFCLLADGHCAIRFCMEGPSLRQQPVLTHFGLGIMRMRRVGMIKPPRFRSLSAKNIRWNFRKRHSAITSRLLFTGRLNLLNFSFGKPRSILVCSGRWDFGCILMESPLIALLLLVFLALSLFCFLYLVLRGYGGIFERT